VSAQPAQPSPPAKPPRDPLAVVFWILVLLICPALALLMVFRPAASAEIPVLTRDVPAYHWIDASEVMSKTLKLSDLPPETVRDAQALVGAYTRQAVSPEKPISTSQIGAVSDTNLISDTIAVAIPANSATLVGGSVRAGDVVILSSVPLSDTNASSIVFDRVLVLDAKSDANNSVIVLAIPALRWQEFLDKTRNAQIVLARRVQ
jgi:Flp pilus assembly protein CpaB